MIADLRRFGIVSAAVLALMMELVVCRQRLKWRRAALWGAVDAYAG